ncbi:MAG TPA: glycoside hydrolase family 19 protein [Pyrinomonadaceae bacterium]|nr:glycoside hydrolase family 19 protein [Pyrinomonadaceae bacterium]
MRAFTDEEVLTRVRSLPTFTGFPKGPMDVWIRSTADVFDTFDDKAFTYECYGDAKPPKFIMARNGTTNAGSYGLKHFEDYNHDGCAVLKSDVIVYDSHAFGLHKKKDAYRQVKEFPYFRDGNRNDRAEEIPPERKDIILANVHRAGVDSTVINNWSVACLVTANLSKFLSWLKWMNKRPLTVCILKEWASGVPAPAKTGSVGAAAATSATLTAPLAAGTFAFDRKKFFEAYRTRFGPLTQPLVDALEYLLGRIEADTRFGTTDADRRQLAYCLATFKWETAHTFEPIDERGGDAYFNKRYGPGTKAGTNVGNTQPGDGALFHGRGYVQLTGRANYTKAKKLTGVDLLSEPDRAKERALAYQIAIQGMIDGWFTTRKLAQYFKPDGTANYENARAIINGSDQATRIADIARRFSEILLEASQ